MNLIEEKAQSEKYFAAITYYFHNSNEKVKEDTLKILLDKNIYLAAHCVSTDFPNQVYIEKAIKVAIDLSKDFNKEELSSKALLALAELKQFDQIIDLFDKIKKPVKLHFAVLNRVFQQADQGTFLKFIETFIGRRSVKAYATSFLQYPSQFDLQPDVLQILKLFIKRLFKDESFGVLKAFLEKYNLYDFLDFFFEVPALELCERLLLSKNYRHLILAFEIVSKFKFFRMIGFDRLIEIYASSSSEKMLKYAVQVAVDYEVFGNQRLNDQLLLIFQSYFAKPYRKQLQNVKLVNRMINFGIVDYVKNVDFICLHFLQFCFLHKIKLFSNLSMAPTEVYSKDPEIYFASDRIELVVKAVVESEAFNVSTKSAYDFWIVYFSSLSPLIKSFPIEPIVERVCEIYNIDLRAHFKILRQFSHTGFIQNGNDMGQFVYPQHFRSIKQLFLHNQQIINYRTFETRFDAKIQFRLIGYNIKSKRLNISELPLEELISNGIKWETDSQQEK